jgi:hypothetical protein
MSNTLGTGGYEEMARAVRDCIEELLIPFHAASDAPGLLQSMSTDEFFRKFLVCADKSTEQCCQELSKVFRQISVVPEVRGAPTMELAKQIRQTVFGTTDKILVSYIGSLEEIKLDLLETFRRSFADSSMLGEAMKGAAIGRVAGGFGDGGKVLGAVGAIAAASKEVMKQQALLEHQQKLLDDARYLAYAKIIEYLKAVETLPENLLDYGCAKCFGGQIDFAKQALAIEQVRSSVKEKMQHSVELTLKLQQIEREAAEKARKAAAAEKEQESVESANVTKKGCGGCLIAWGGIALIGVIGGISENSWSDFLWQVVGCVVFIAIGCYVWRKGKEKTRSASAGPPFGAA